MNPHEIKLIHDIVWDLLKEDFKGVVEYFKIPLNIGEGRSMSHHYIDVMNYFNERYMLSPPPIINQLKHYILYKKMDGDIKECVDPQAVFNLIKKKLNTRKSIESLQIDLDHSYISKENFNILMKKMGAHKTNIKKKFKLFQSS